MIELYNKYRRTKISDKIITISVPVPPQNALCPDLLVSRSHSLAHPRPERLPKVSVHVHLPNGAGNSRKSKTNMMDKILYTEDSIYVRTCVSNELSDRCWATVMDTVIRST